MTKQVYCEKAEIGQGCEQESDKAVSISDAFSK